MSEELEKLANKMLAVPTVWDRTSVNGMVDMLNGVGTRTPDTSAKVDVLELQTIQERDDAQDAADEMASLILGEDINWSDHSAKWKEAIAALQAPRSDTRAVELSEDKAVMILAEALCDEAESQGDIDEIPFRDAKILMRAAYRVLKEAQKTKAEQWLKNRGA